MGREPASGLVPGSRPCTTRAATAAILAILRTLRLETFRRARDVDLSVAGVQRDLISWSFELTHRRGDRRLREHTRKRGYTGTRNLLRAEVRRRLTDVSPLTGRIHFQAWFRIL